MIFDKDETITPLMDYEKAFYEGYSDYSLYVYVLPK